jgi:uncharacterized protein YdcH (DUF465 family)
MIGTMNRGLSNVYNYSQSQENAIQSLRAQLAATGSECKSEVNLIREKNESLRERVDRIEGLTERHKGQKEQQMTKIKAELKDEIRMTVKLEMEKKWEEMQNLLECLRSDNQALTNEIERLRANRVQPVKFNMPTLLLRCDHLVCIQHPCTWSENHRVGRMPCSPQTMVASLVYYTQYQQGCDKAAPLPMRLISVNTYFLSHTFTVSSPYALSQFREKELEDLEANINRAITRLPRNQVPLEVYQFYIEI